MSQDKPVLPEITHDWVTAYMKAMRLTNRANAICHIRAMLRTAPHASAQTGEGFDMMAELKRRMADGPASGSPDEKGGSHAAELSSAVDVMPGAAHPDKHASDISALVERLEVRADKGYTAALSFYSQHRAELHDCIPLLREAAQALRTLEAGRDFMEGQRDGARQYQDALQSELDRVRNLLDRAYKMMWCAGYRVVEHNPEHNNPIIAWMADARTVLGSDPTADLTTLGERG